MVSSTPSTSPSSSTPTSTSTSTSTSSSPPAPSLHQTLSTTLALTSHLISTLSSPPPPTNPPTSPPTVPPPSPQPNPLSNPLHLLPAPLSLLRAHTTKLTLLVLTPPFTPTAIASILRETSTGALPALVGTVQSFTPQIYGDMFATEVKDLSGRLVRGWEGLIGEVEEVAKKAEGKEEGAESGEEGGMGMGRIGIGNGGDSGGGKGSAKGGKEEKKREQALKSTGVVWGLCDEMLKVCEVGVAGLAERKMGGWKELYKDAVEELEGWLEGDGSERGDEVEGLVGEMKGVRINGEGARSSSGSSTGSFSSLDGLDEGPSAEIRPLAEWSLMVLKHVGMLYPPLIKRRIKRFPNVTSAVQKDAKEEELPSQEQLERLEGILRLGKGMSEGLDGIIEGLYNDDGEQVKARLKESLKLVEDESDKASFTWGSWDNKSLRGDELTVWLGKWRTKMREMEEIGRRKMVWS